MCAKIVRLELDIAILDIFVHTFRCVDEAFCSVTARVETPHGEGPRHQVDAAVDGAILACDFKASWSILVSGCWRVF